MFNCSLLNCVFFFFKTFSEILEFSLMKNFVQKLKLAFFQNNFIQEKEREVQGV